MKNGKYCYVGKLQKIQTAYASSADLGEYKDVTILRAMAASHLSMQYCRGYDLQKAQALFDTMPALPLAKMPVVLASSAGRKSFLEDSP